MLSACLDRDGKVAAKKECNFENANLITLACERPVTGAHQMRSVDPATLTTLSVEAQPPSCTQHYRNTQLLG